MKKVIFIVILICIGWFFWRRSPSPSPTSLNPTPSPQIQITPVEVQNASIFVPYWEVETISEVKLPQIDSLSQKKPTLIYFGISPTTSDINASDSGFANLDAFVEGAPPNTPKLLTIRLLEDRTTIAIL